MNSKIGQRKKNKHWVISLMCATEENKIDKEKKDKPVDLDNRKGG